MINYKTASKSELLSEYRRLSELVGGYAGNTEKEFLHLPQILKTDEIPLAIASGTMEKTIWLLVLTNLRVIFLDKGLFFGLTQIDISLNNIVSIGGKTGLLWGDISISTAEKSYVINNVMKKVVVPFTNLVNETRDRLKEEKNDYAISSASSSLSSTHDQNDIISQLERLAHLKEQGILNEDEFEKQKQKILNNR